MPSSVPAHPSAAPPEEAPQLPEPGTEEVEEQRQLRELGLRWANQLPTTTSAWRVDPDIEIYEEDEDTGGGTGVLRLSRIENSRLERQDDMIRVTRSGQEAQRGLSSLRKVFLGEPIATARQVHERLSKIKAMAILSSDPLSSVAYATEQTQIVLLPVGAALLAANLPIAAAIAALLLIVGISYRQTIKTYPNGGGSYIVAKDNLGPVPGLIAAAALMTDYILTVSVSVSAGVDAVTSAFPGLQPFTVAIGVSVIAVMVLVNLRGVREAGTVFAAPTYIFISGMVLLIIFGGIHLATQGNATPLAHTTNDPNILGSEAKAFILLVVLRAFSSGCTALTGVEAISNGVPIFKPPEWRNARTTLSVMIGLAVIMFVGTTLLASAFQIWPDSSGAAGYQTVLSKLGHVAFASGPLYYYLQAGTALILILAANTSFADFPRLLYLLARDKYAPSQFVNVGDRLSFSNGIITLGVLSGFLYWFFRGSTDALIPLYTIGVFLAFTLSQAGMVQHWRKLSRSPNPDDRRGWRRSMAMNLTGAVATAVVLVIAAGSKFTSGAWVVILLIPIMVGLFLGVHRHYTGVKRRVKAETPLTPGEVYPIAVVPVSDLSEPQLQALALARRIADEVVAVIITDSHEKIEEIRAKWKAWGGLVPLEVIESPYRSLVRPFLDYLSAIEAQHQRATIMVVLPELVYGRWWHQFLHNQTAARLKLALLFRPGTVVINVPYHLREEKTGEAA